jgi:predicted double-glycine peptidase
VLRISVACATLIFFVHARADGPVRSLLEIRQADVVIQRWDISCGAAALATVLTYGFGDNVSEKSVAQGMLRRTDPLRVRVRGGFSLLDMKRFVEARGYSAMGYRDLSVDELLAMHDPIVPIQELGAAHFVVVRGLRDAQIDVADPAWGNRRMSIKHFENVWRDGIGFIVTRGKN